MAETAYKNKYMKNVMIEFKLSYTVQSSSQGIGNTSDK